MTPILTEFRECRPWTFLGHVTHQGHVLEVYNLENAPIGVKVAPHASVVLLAWRGPREVRPQDDEIRPVSTAGLASCARILATPMGPTVDLDRLFGATRRSEGESWRLVEVSVGKGQCLPIYLSLIRHALAALPETTGQLGAAALMPFESLERPGGLLIEAHDMGEMGRKFLVCICNVDQAQCSPKHPLDLTRDFSSAR